MADHDERWVLNHLIEMCRDEELTLRYAADHVKDPSVKTLFVELASQRAQFAADSVPACRAARRRPGGRRHGSRGAAPRLDGLKGRAEPVR